jgi:hypothetical protein
MAFDQLESPPGFRIRCHHLHGQLTDVIVYDTGDRYRLLGQIGREAAKVYAISQKSPSQQYSRRVRGTAIANQEYLNSVICAVPFGLQSAVQPNQIGKST